MTDWGVLRARAPRTATATPRSSIPSGGSGDSFTLAIAHKEGEIGILDCVREVRPPFSPEAVVQEFADLLKTYRVTKVRGDRYARRVSARAVRQAGHQVRAERRSEEHPSIVNFLPLINSGKVRLLGNKRLVTQLIGLERRTSRAVATASTTPPAVMTTWRTPQPVPCSRRRRRCRRCDAAPSTSPGRASSLARRGARSDSRIRIVTIDQGRQEVRGSIRRGARLRDRYSDGSLVA